MIALPSTARVLVRATNWLGDIMISLPALRALRERFAGGHLGVLVRHNLADIYRMQTWIDEVIPLTLRRGLPGLGDRRRAAAQIRGRRFDLTVLFPNSFDSALLAFLARIPHRLGYARDGRSLLLTDRVVATREIVEDHQARYYLNLLECLGVPSALGNTPGNAPQDARLEVSEAALADADTLLAELHGAGPIVAMAAGAAFGPAKEWPEDHYVAFARGLAAQRGARIVLVGAPGEKVKCDRIAARLSDLPTGALATAGRTSVATLAALLSRCTAFVGNDSGAMHVAGVVGIPTVGIFGSTRPDRTSPLGPATAVVRKPIDCSPCMKRVCPYGHYRCLTDIAPAEVAARLDDITDWSAVSAKA